MNLFKHREQNNLFWILLGISIFFICLRMPSLIEPYWYGDEGIYQVIGKALNNGYILYKDIWDNKPPLLYFVYALGNGDQLILRSLSLIVGTFSSVIFFFLAQIVLKSQRAALLATLLYVVLFATPIIEGNIANAENFMILPIIISALLIYKETDQRRGSLPAAPLSFPIAGFLLGTAFLLKIVALFDLAAFCFFLLLLSMNHLHLSLIHI